MKIKKIFLVPLLLIYYNSIYAETFVQDKKNSYVFLSSFCAYSIDRQFSPIEMTDFYIYTNKNKETNKKEPAFYTKEECVNKLREELLYNAIGISEYRNDNYYTYIGGGLYQLDFGYYRYACAKYDDILKYIEYDKVGIFIDYENLPKELVIRTPWIIDENNLQIFNNIFPLDKDENESIEFTKKFDEEMREKIKVEVKKSKEEQRKERLEEQRRKKDSGSNQ